MVASPYTIAYISARHGILELTRACDPGRPAGDSASRPYRQVEAVDDVVDSLVVGQQWEDAAV
jgi:hypothetical protein